MKKAYNGLNNMKEDPLDFLFKLNGYKLTETVRKYRLYTMVIAVYCAIFNILPIYRSFFAADEHRICLIGVFIIIPSIGSIFFGAIYCYDLEKYEHTLRVSCMPIYSQGIEVKEKILYECKLLKIFSSCLCLYSLLVHMSFVSFTGEQYEFMCQVTSLKQPLGQFYVFGVVAFAAALASAGILVISHFSIPSHIVFHLRFQYILLNAYAEDLHRPRTDFDADDDTEYQNYIYHKLTKCVEHHLRIKRIFDSLLLELQDIPMALFSISGLTAFVTCLYIIITDLSPQNNFKIVMVISIVLVMFLSSCFCGQILSDESIRFHNLLCESPWMNWNKKNRNCLLIILPNTVQPLKISCFGLHDLDYCFILKAIQVTYSLLTVATSFR